MKLSQLKIPLVIFVCAVAIIVAAWFVLNSSADYQMYMLKNGTTQYKLRAMEVLSNKGYVAAVPLIVEYIDSDEWDFYHGGNDPATLSCSATLALTDLTNYPYGHTCNSSAVMSEIQITEIRKNWKDWYRDEYPTWAAEHGVDTK